MVVNGKSLFFLMFLFLKIQGQERAFNDKMTLSLPDSYNIGWMQTLDDHQLISDITIPGTHDTMALYGGPAAECQKLSLEDQLMAGIRYLDLRVFASEKKLYVMHGVIYEHSSFPKVLKTIKAFLSEFRSETVLVRVKPDLFDKSNVQVLIQNMIENDSDFWIQSLIPTMGDVRGKIVFVQKDSFKMGVPLLETDTKGDYEVTHVEEKENDIRENLRKANEYCGDDLQSSVVLTYSSGTGIGTLGGMFLTPKRIAKEINPWLYGYLDEVSSKNPKICFGVVAMDFPGFDLIQMVINFNN
ncbi:1-phosphatidylinositol phosphodiesterase-like [Triplophysa dalaica]|uniref:1-phosphatidylinositol phosphodiesterase-like n=1 Tax=Triplophysa dalaica TaxID=1582913 RepID=UPI0024DFA7CF|nr:1-phosphatidylinositol phosphodiesterase-like [Triplophysa dalaica]